MAFEWGEVCGRDIVRVLAVVGCRLRLCVISIALFLAAVLVICLSVSPKIDIISPAVLEIDTLSGMVGVVEESGDGGGQGGGVVRPMG